MRHIGQGEIQAESEKVPDNGEMLDLQKLMENNTI